MNGRMLCMSTLAIAMTAGFAAPVARAQDTTANDPPTQEKMSDRAATDKAMAAKTNAGQSTPDNAMATQAGSRRQSMPDRTMAHDGDMMAKMDTDNDGMVSASEHAAFAKGMFDRMDSNHDGMLSRAEMDAGMQSMRKGMHDTPKMQDHSNHDAMMRNDDSSMRQDSMPKNDPMRQDATPPSDTQSDGMQSEGMPPGSMRTDPPATDDATQQDEAMHEDDDM